MPVSAFAPARAASVKDAVAALIKAMVFLVPVASSEKKVTD